MTFKTISAVVMAGLLVTGCATTNTSNPSNAPAAMQHGRILKSFMLKELHPTSPQQIFVLVEPADNGWSVVSMHSKRPKRTRPTQEILLTNADFKYWSTALDNYKAVCKTKKPFDFSVHYNACTSALSTKVSYFALLAANPDNDTMYENDAQLHRSVINALPETQLQTHYAQFLVSEQQRKAREEAHEAEQKRIDEHERLQAKARRAEELRQAQAQAKAIVAKASKEPRGTEDHCERTQYGTLLTTLDPSNVSVRCAFTGFNNIDQFQSAGWIVISKDRDTDGVVNSYIIRKVR